MYRKCLVCAAPVCVHRTGRYGSDEHPSRSNETFDKIMVEDHKEPDKKIAILEATLELIAELGFHNTPTSKIAEKAGVGVGSIYRYFTDKEELIHALFNYVVEKESQEILREYNTNVPIREQFMQLCTRMIRYSVQHPKEFKFLEQYFHSPYGLSRRREMLLEDKAHNACKPPIHTFFETAKTQQIVKDLPLFLLGALTFGPIIALLRDIHAGLVEYDAELMHKTIEACWDAVKR